MQATSSAITRKSFIAAGLGAIASAAIAGVAHADTPAAPTTFTPGVYVGRAQGYKSEYAVYVECSEDQITAVALGENNETHTRVPSETAAKIICQDIVDHQSLAVDTVSGATFSSMGIIAAATAALEQSGADMAALKAPFEREAVAHDDEEYDVVIVGSGVAGLMAALSCVNVDFGRDLLADSKAGFDEVTKQVDLTRQKTDLSVLVVEKAAFPGGSSMLSDGGYALCSGTVCNEMYDTAFTGEGLANFLEDFMGGPVNRPLVNRMVEISGSTANGVFNLGSPFAIAKTELRLKLDNGEGYVSIRAKQYSDPRTDGAFGARITDNFVENLREMGGEIRCNCAATELIVEDGAVAGIIVNEKGSEYAIRAKKVVLAAGGFAQNREMIEQYAPTYVGSHPYCCGNCKGDGINMAVEKFGTKVVGVGLNAYPGADFRWGMGGQLCGIMEEGVYVNKEGERFYDARDYDVRVVPSKICEQTDQMCYSIVDNSSSFVKTGMLEYAEERDWAWQADTLEELAEKIGVPFEPMMASVESMRAAYAAGEDDPAYNVPAKFLNPIAEPPFVAFVVRSVAIGSLSGLEVTEECEVLDGNGNVVPNLFAAGETMIGNLFTNFYPLGSFSVGSCINTGRIAGERAKATLLEERA